ncbi:nitrite reductase [Luteococcus sp. Sow4_B9]|uniref:nitrite reductase n=1 Tax=Luteococcus sp. Sow4_B9 TaxID=3438792 RepID=UPI003F9AEB44
MVRIRLVAGNLPVDALRAVARAASQYGDGRIHPTNRANLQLRAFPDDGTGRVTPEALTALEASGLLPAPGHDLVRNVMASPLTGVDGGRANLEPLALALDEGIRASDRLATLPGKFLFVVDDGRGDVLSHACDLGVVALDEQTVQLRIGSGWGEVLPLADAAEILLGLAELFVERRGNQPTAAWHVDELDAPLVPTVEADPRLPEASGPLPFGDGPGWRHVEIGEAGIGATQVLDLVEGYQRVRITPWYGLLLCESWRSQA